MGLLTDKCGGPDRKPCLSCHFICLVSITAAGPTDSVACIVGTFKRKQMWLNTRLKKYSQKCVRKGPRTGGTLCQSNVIRNKIYGRYMRCSHWDSIYPFNRPDVSTAFTCSHCPINTASSFPSATQCFAKATLPSSPKRSALVISAVAHIVCLDFGGWESVSHTTFCFPIGALVNSRPELLPAMPGSKEGELCSTRTTPTSY